MIATLSATAGFAANEWGSANIRDNSLRGIDIRDGSLGPVELSDTAKRQLKGDRGAQGPRGTQGARGAEGAQGETGADGEDGEDGTDATYAGPNWSIVDRNVIADGDSYLRSGPAGGPAGVGSLGLRTGSPDDKATFGNQVDFLGDPLSGLSTVSYHVFTTGENRAKYFENLPSVNMEIDPSGAASTDGPNYTSLVYVPVEQTTNGWTKQDASTADRWFMTGAAGVGSCNQGPEGYCTLAEVKVKYPNASILTVQITKGRDYAFSGAVDALQLNDTVYDFEPFGVTESEAP